MQVYWTLPTRPAMLLNIQQLSVVLRVLLFYKSVYIIILVIHIMDKHVWDLQINKYSALQVHSITLGQNTTKATDRHYIV